VSTIDEEGVTMKKLILILAVQITVFISVGYGDDYGGNEELKRIHETRTQALMDKLEVTPASSDKIQRPCKPVFTKESISGVTLHKSGTKDGYISGERLYFRHNGKTDAYIHIYYRNSAQEAQLELFEDLAGCTLPTEGLLLSYVKVPKGPGDLCIAGNVKPTHNKTLEECTPVVYFTRANIFVSVISDVPEISAMEIARKVDTILAGSMEQQGKHSPEPR